uniref:Reverse transcriptase Ty1/copia-type domain-containing protein n=1 Tax=Tanacetum cinerariifolium TaxID=118510 RepID=A0A6L2N9S6_TANCI|nr:hypothetical protein [Tanacetum cinerariifolium]
MEKPKTIRSRAPIIEDWELDSDDDDYVIRPSIEQNKPSYAKINFVNSDENTRKFAIEQHTYRKLKTLGKVRILGKSVFKNKGKATGQREVRPVWNNAQRGNLQYTLKDQGIFNNGYSRHMTRNKSFLIDYQEIDGGFVAFGGSPKGGKTTRKDQLDKFEGKADEGFLVRYSVNSKAFRVFNTRTKKVEENLHIKSIEIKSNVAGSGPEWLFDIDSLTKSINYEPVTAGNQTNDDVDNKDADEGPDKRDEGVSKGSGVDDQERNDNSTQDVNTPGPSINTGSLNINTVGSNDLSMPSLEETDIFDDVYDDREVGAEADTNNLELPTVFTFIPTIRVHKDHPKDQIIRDLNLATQTWRMIKFSKENAMVSYINKQRRTNHKDDQNCLFACFLSQQEPKKIYLIARGPLELNGSLETKNMRGIVIRNKARLVAQGYTQEEGIVYDEVFALVVRIEVIRLFLAYASFMRFIVYQMDVKSAFLYGTIEEEVYVSQPPGFKDPHFPDKVYKVEKALYGLHQAPRALYETLSTYLLENRFRRGTIDKTLFIKKDIGDNLLVQVYVDDIIFWSTKKFLCDEFEQMMHKRFQISSIGDLTFFLELQVKQKDDGIFINQDKYVADILKKFDFTTMKTSSIPMEPNKALIKDSEAEDVDVHLYKSMIGSLMYLVVSRPDIMFAICACVRFQVTPKTSHLHDVKRIFRYLKEMAKVRKLELKLAAELKLVLNGCLDWKETAVNVEIQVSAVSLTYYCFRLTFAGSAKQYDWIRCDDTKVLRMGQTVLLGSKGFHQIVDFLNTSHIKYALTKNLTIYVSLIQQFWQTAAANTLDTGEVQITATIDGKVKLVFEASIRRHLKLKDSDGISILPNTEIFEQLAFMGAFNFSKMIFEGMVKNLDRSNSASEGSTVSVESHHTPSGAPSTSQPPLSSPSRIPTRQETKVPQPSSPTHANVADETKRVYSTAFKKLIMKVKKLEKIVKSNKARRRAKIVVSDDEDAVEDTSKHERKIDAIDQDPDTSLVQHDAEVQGRHDQEIKFEIEDTSTAETLGYIKRSASKGKEEMQRIARVYKEASSFNVEEWEDIQATIDAEEELALRIQAKEKEKYSKAKKARLLVDLINQRKRHFAQQRAEERRNKPLTQAQQRTYMSNYIKHMGSYTLKQLKRLSFDEIKNLFEATMKRVKKFPPMESDTGESSEPREKEDDELTQKDLQQMMMMVLVEEVYVESLQVKYLIIDWEFYIEESRKYWRIIKVRNHTETYHIFTDTLKKFNRDDLVKLCNLVKERFSTIEPTDDKEKDLWVELKRLFKPDNDDTLWKLQRYMHDPLRLLQLNAAGLSFYCWVQEFLLLVEESTAGED